MKKKKIFAYGELTDLVLNTIADCLKDLKWYNRPSIYVILGEVIKLILEKRRVEKTKIKRMVREMEKRELISIKEKDKDLIVHLKDKGKDLVIKYSLQKILNFKKKEKKWNGKWFMVFFDVPESQRNKRDTLRRYLDQLGFFQYQKSVYIFPYECEEEVLLIKKIVEGGKYMKYIIAEKIEDEEKIKAQFNLTI